MTKKIDPKITNILKNGGIGILPTDTLYGLVGSALSEKAVLKVAILKKRGKGKPFIILISKISGLKIFGVEINQEEKSIIKKYWPGPVSIVLKCPNHDREMSYLQPLNQTLAFRCPNLKWLNVLLKATGPLVAPSANPEEFPPAETIEQAKKYFGNTVDFYVDRGKLRGLPSTLVEIQGDNVVVRRSGAIKI